MKKITKIFLFASIFLTLLYTYYYLPKKYSTTIEVKDKEIISNIKDTNSKNTFSNTEYKSQNDRGQIYTTKAKESYLYQEQPNLINLIEPYSFTKLEKDQSLVEITSKTGLYDKKEKTTQYTDNVIIKNKNYLISANSAKYYPEKNIIIISEKVIMKDLTLGLSHILYCDIVEINTKTNDAIAYMNSKNDQVIAKKFK